MSRVFALVAASFLLSTSGTAQTASKPIDVQHYEVSVELAPETSFLEGEAVVRLRILENTPTLPFDLNSNLSVIEVLGEGGRRYSVQFDDFDSTRMLVRGDDRFQEGAELTLRFRFEGRLEREHYAFLEAPRSERAVISSDGALLLSEGKWFPSHDLPLDTATATLRITVPLGFTAVGPGSLQPIETQVISESFIWKIDRPTGSFPVLVSRFFRQTFNNGPVPLTFYVTREFDGDLEPWADSIAEMIEFFRSEYGDLPFEELTLAATGNVDLPTATGSGLILLESALLERRSVPLTEMARRVARQWWAHSVAIEAPFDAWMQDGFAAYAALRYLQVRHEEQFPTELARQAVEALKHERRAPIVRGFDLGVGSPEYESVVVSKGAWVLHMLGRLMGGEQLDSAVSDWYARHAGRTATTPRFVDFIEERTGESYRWFFEQWLESVGVPEFRVDFTVFRLTAGGYQIRGHVRQNVELFRMPVDLHIETRGEPKKTELQLKGASTSFIFDTEEMPVGVQVDPDGKILRDSPGMRVAVHIALGEDYKERGEYVSAVQEFEKARELDPRNSLASFRLAEVYFEQQSFTNAANTFREVLNGDLEPSWVETWAHIFMGKIYDILGQRQRALAEYQKAINSEIDYNGAQSEARRYLEEPYSRPRGVIG